MTLNPARNPVGKCLLYVWASPGSLLGLMAAVLAYRQGGECRVVEGVLEVTSPRVLNALSRRSAVCGGIAAITLGHVVIGRDRVTLEETRRHERVHVRQYECWGPFFIPAYLACSAWLSMRGRHPYLDNPFEVEAYREDGLPL